MKGSITKYIVKGSSRPKWRYRLRLGKDENGQEIRDGRGGFAKEGDAREAMKIRIEEILKERNAPAAPDTTPATLAAWLTCWIDTYAVLDCERTTVQRYRQLARYITEAQAPEIVLIAKTPIKALEKMHGAIETAMYALLRQKAKRRKHLSPKSVSHVAALLSVALNKAFRLGDIDVNPMLRVQLPKVPKKKAISLGEDQFRLLRKTCREDPMWFAFVEVVSALGGRRGEGLALQWPDLDKVIGTVTVSKSLAQTKDDGIFVKVTKEDEVHQVQLNQSAIAALQIWQEIQADHKRKFGKDYNDQKLIFAEPNGDFLNPAYVSQRMKRLMQKAGVMIGSLHSLRHTSATMLHHKNIPMATISKRLGHSDLTTTERIYTHAVADDDRRAAEAWEEIIQAADAWEGVTPAKGSVQ